MEQSKTGGSEYPKKTITAGRLQTCSGALKSPKTSSSKHFSESHLPSGKLENHQFMFVFSILLFVFQVFVAGFLGVVF